MTVRAQTTNAPVRSARPTTQPAVHKQPIQQAPKLQLLQQVTSTATTAALAVSLAMLPMGAAHAAAPSQLADLLREQFGFVDSNSDGLVTK